MLKYHGGSEQAGVDLAHPYALSKAALSIESLAFPALANNTHITTRLFSKQNHHEQASYMIVEICNWNALGQETHQSLHKFSILPMLPRYHNSCTSTRLYTQKMHSVMRLNPLCYWKNLPEKRDIDGVAIKQCSMITLKGCKSRASREFESLNFWKKISPRP